MDPVGLNGPATATTPSFQLNGYGVGFIGDFTETAIAWRISGKAWIASTSAPCWTPG